MSRKEITPNILGMVFGNIQKIEYTEDCLTIFKKKNNSKYVFGYSASSDLPRRKKTLLGSKIILQAGTRKFSLNFLENSSTNRAFPSIVESSVIAISENISKAAAAFKTLALDQYLRESEIEGLDDKIRPLVESYIRSKPSWKENFSDQAIALLNTFSNFSPLKHNAHTLRLNFEENQKLAKNSFFDRVESNPLTEQQRLAVIRNNDRNLVLAAAGTGKTSVMVAKALDLIYSTTAKPEDVLVLAYNRSAANELKERINQRGLVFQLSESDQPSVSTFHELGLKILRDSNTTTYLSEFSNDRKKLLMWVTKWIREYVASSPASLQNYIELSYQPINPFDFETKQEYDAYVRDNEYRTLQGERVLGYQELLIANWLFLNGIEYEYEAPYVTKHRIDIGFDYRPDFHIKNSNIYIEHFGIDRLGNTRPDIDKQDYNEKIESKRALHLENETVLLETFHYDWKEENLESRLEQLTVESGLEPNPKSPEDILTQLNELGFIDEGSQRYLKCLEAIRVERLDFKKILDRLKGSNITQAKRYCDLLDALHSAYKEELNRQDRIDFDDMIIKAIDTIKGKRYSPKWKHILVDEFQDISMSRMELLNKLVEHGPNPSLTVVGDDWQAIYRFAGGKLELTTRFDTLVGSNTVTKLDKTFRYNNSIAEIAGTFVMQNPEQYKKHINTNAHVDQPQVYLLDSKAGVSEFNLEAKVLQVLTKISESDPAASISVLARYHYLLDNVKEHLRRERRAMKLNYWTFHGSKGLESDYCVLIGFFQGKTGFPNENEEEAVVEALLPSLDAFPHSEERRLLYVALTRARRKCYIIADPMAPSEFVNEILAPKYSINIVSKTFTEQYRKIFKCPTCSPGYFALKTGKFGTFYSCTSGSVCRSNPRVCEKCGAPSLDRRRESICNNPNCGSAKDICDICGRPMKLRAGKYGKFWGCTGYGIKEDQCKNTRRI